MSADSPTDCAWCGGRGWYHVGAGNWWECPICLPSPRRRLHAVERRRIEQMRRPLPPGFQEVLDTSTRNA